MEMYSQSVKMLFSSWAPFPVNISLPVLYYHLLNSMYFIC